MKNLDATVKQPGRTRRLVKHLCLLALSAVGACGGGVVDDEVVCTTEARTSVLLTVVDPLNLPLPGVTVAYQVNGGTVQSQACGSTGLCALGMEVSGVFSMTASKPGYTPATGTVAVNRDRCHVITERITLTLRPAA